VWWSWARWSEHSATLWFSEARKLDSGNPNPGNLGSDFARFGLQLWPVLRALSRHTAARQRALDELNLWRNAIAHNDFTCILIPPRLTLDQVQRWRRACAHLARALARRTLCRSAAGRRAERSEARQTVGCAGLLGGRIGEWFSTQVVDHFGDRCGDDGLLQPALQALQVLLGNDALAGKLWHRDGANPKHGQ
jgi:hypothetical protein